MAEIGRDKKKRLFIEAFDGDNTVEAMRVAGYSGAEQYLKTKAKTFLQDPHIVKAIEQRNDYLDSTTKVIATRTERQAFWTSIMRNNSEDLNINPEYDVNGLPKKIEANISLSARMKASELLGKSETDFVDRLDINHNITITDIVQQSYAISHEDIDAIEAQYERLKDQKKHDIKKIESEAEAPLDGGPDLEDFI